MDMRIVSYRASISRVWRCFFLDFSKVLFGQKLQRCERDFRANEGLVIGHVRQISGSKEVEGTSILRTMLI